jgi:ribosomal protein L1
MNEDTLNMEVRKFLKRVGVTSQREIEQAILKAVERGQLQGAETLDIQMTLELPGVDLKHCIEGQIALE